MKRPILQEIPHSDCEYAMDIDNSTLETFQSCPRRGYYYHIRRRERPKSAALSFGGCIHAAIEAWIRNQDWKKVIQDWFVTSPPPEGEYRDAEYALKVMEAYLKTYPVKPQLVQSDALEIGFRIPLMVLHVNRHLDGAYVKRLHVYWTGRIDLVVEVNGDWWVMDHKTSSIAGPSFFDQFYLAQQQVGYVYAAKQIWKRPITGSILDAIICRKITRTGKGIECSRHFFRYDDWHIQEWMSDVKTFTMQFVECWGNDEFPKNTVWCLGKYGKCPYHDVCTMPPDARDILLESDMYSDVDWTPLKGEQVKETTTTLTPQTNETKLIL